MSESGEIIFINPPVRPARNFVADSSLVPGSYYIYAPNKGAPIFFAVAFAVSGSFHLWQCIRYKSFKVTALIPLASLVMAVGYGIREYNAFHYSDIGTYLASVILILVSPPMLELANYHILGRILYYVPYYSPIHPGRTLTTFGSVSAIVEVLNGLGGSWSSSLSPSLTSTGHTLLKISLLLQVCIVVTFVGFTAGFHRRCRAGGLRTHSIDGPCTTMYVSAVLILARCVFRTVETFSVTDAGSGELSPVLRYEWFFYVFEAVPMLADCVLWNLRHPRKYLPENYHVYLARDGVTELEGPGWVDNRPFIATVLDPFGLYRAGNAERKPFWERDGYYGLPA